MQVVYLQSVSIKVHTICNRTLIVVTPTKVIPGTIKDLRRLGRRFLAQLQRNLNMRVILCGKSSLHRSNHNIRTKKAKNMLERSEGFSDWTRHHLQAISLHAYGKQFHQPTQLGHLSRLGCHYRSRSQKITISSWVDYVGTLVYSCSYHGVNFSRFDIIKW
jgi:hypothetical protein